MKFICKNFWEQIFKKQIDNLKTNHQGIYVLTDNRFKFLTQMSESKQFNQFIPRVSWSTISMCVDSDVDSPVELNLTTNSNLTNLTKFFTLAIPQYLAFTCGLLRGSMLNLGINAVVTATVVSPPIVRYQIEVKKS